MSEPPRPLETGELVDAHCHVDLYPSPETIVREAEAAHVHTIAVTNAPSVFAHTEALTRGCRFVHPAVGLHPELVKSHAAEITAMWPLLERTRFVGEIGLDYVTPDRGERSLQRNIFEEIVAHCDSVGNKVLTVHSRRAVRDVISVIGQRFSGKVILHWFSGSVSELRASVAAQMWFSVNPAMIGSTNGQRLIAEMPPDRLLAETDGPFVNVGPRPARPTDAELVVRYLSTVWHAELQEVRSRLSSNWQRLIVENVAEVTRSPDASEASADLSSH